MQYKIEDYVNTEISLDSLVIKIGDGEYKIEVSNNANYTKISVNYKDKDGENCKGEVVLKYNRKIGKAIQRMYYKAQANYPYGVAEELKILNKELERISNEIEREIEEEAERIASEEIIRDIENRDKNRSAEDQILYIKFLVNVKYPATKNHHKLYQINYPPIITRSSDFQDPVIKLISLLITIVHQVSHIQALEMMEDNKHQRQYSKGRQNNND